MEFDQCAAKHGRTQRVTQADIKAGRIRVPVSGKTKSLLPGGPTRIAVVLKGVQLGERAYNPRFEGSHERSAVISVDAATLRELVTEDEVLPIVVARTGVVYIGDRGSKLRIAQCVCDKSQQLNGHLVEAAPTLRDFAVDRELRWHSPLRESDFRELSAGLWRELELPPPDPYKDGFWPSRHPHWDAVATANGVHGTRGVVLVEAKSHLDELVSHCAASPASAETIATSLSMTKRYLGVADERDWMRTHYQAANRYAFLYYLRARRSIPTWLFFVYFTGDAFEVDGVPQRCPADEGEWKSAIDGVHAHLGLPACHPLTHFVANVFLPVS